MRNKTLPVTLSSRVKWVAVAQQEVAVLGMHTVEMGAKALAMLPQNAGSTL
jgi:hypothetical protein